MGATIKNIIILSVVGLVLVLIYIFFIKSDAPEPSLVSGGDPASGVVDTLNQNPSLTQDFLSVLLNVNNIKLNDAIFSEPAFVNLHDSSIILVPDGTEGRPNPFAPFGAENTVSVTPPAEEVIVSTPPSAAASSPATTTPPKTTPKAPSPVTPPPAQQPAPAEETPPASSGSGQLIL